MIGRVNTPIRVLIVEDSENDVQLLMRELRKAGFVPSYKRVETKPGMLSALGGQKWDLVVSDFVMPEFSGIEALKTLRETGTDLPFIIVSGQIGEDVAVEAMKAGAHDYIMKGNPKRLGLAVSRELAEAENRRERKRAEEQLRASEAKLRVLTTKLLQLQEEERKGLARELHDQIGQSLNLLKLLLDRSLRSGGKEGRDLLQQSSSVLNELIESVSALSLELRPKMLDDLGLMDALDWHIDRFTARTHVQVHFEKPGLKKQLPLDVSTAVYRIVQEALSNIARHARSRRAIVQVKVGRNAVHLRIEDYGKGFDPAAITTTEAMGISGMQERAALLGGTLGINSAPGKGTCLVAEIPLGRHSSPTGKSAQ